MTNEYSSNNLASQVRPQKFNQIIGQDLVCHILKNSVKDNRISNAYLFCGAKGTGKTSLARILAKAINCKSLIDNEPCDKCNCCIDIKKGVCPDVLEIDAASNRGIDNIRELCNSTNFQPIYCKYKVYIIDEVHMLTIESFNALLKTLEEPPSNVKFVLATTNPNKIPETIHSRCLRFDLSLIEFSMVKSRLIEICKLEEFILDDSILNIISQKSEGSMRDALNMLDLLFNFDQKTLTLGLCQKIFGFVSEIEILNLWQEIFNKNRSKIIKYINELFSQGIGTSVIISDMLRSLREITLAAQIKKNDLYWKNKLPNIVKIYYQIAKKQHLTKLFLAFDVLVDLELKTARGFHDGWMLEMALIKLTFLEDLSPVIDLLNKSEKIKNKTDRINNQDIIPNPISKPNFQENFNTAFSNVKNTNDISATISKSNTNVDSSNFSDLSKNKITTNFDPTLSSKENWIKVLTYIESLNNGLFRTSLYNSKLIAFTDKLLHLGYKKNNINLSNENKELLVSILTDYCKNTVKLKITNNIDESEKTHHDDLSFQKKQRYNEIKNKIKESPTYKEIDKLIPNTKIVNIKITTTKL